MRDHGVGPEFAREVGQAGFGKVSVDDLVRLRDHGVSAAFLKTHKDGRSIDEIIRLRDRGPDFN
jgi:hypothetical protein